MGLLGFVKFALLCIHFFIWPIVALGYPLCASIRAIESGSKCHMRKLVIYWTLFSLVYLFELTFVKIIQWIPFWSCIKLVATVWLVFPRFNGAVQVYQSFVHPFLSVKLQAAITRYNKLKEEKPLTPEAFLNIAEKYMKENGFETLEQLIMSKRECKKPDSSHSDIRVQRSDEQNAAAASKQLNAPDSDSAQENGGMTHKTEQSASSESKLYVMTLHNLNEQELAFTKRDDRQQVKKRRRRRSRAKILTTLSSTTLNDAVRSSTDYIQGDHVAASGEGVKSQVNEPFQLNRA